MANLAQTTQTTMPLITAFFLGDKNIKLLSHEGNEIGHIQRRDFEQWLKSETDELTWDYPLDANNPERGYLVVPISFTEFWNYTGVRYERIINRLSEYHSLTLQTA